MKIVFLLAGLVLSLKSYSQISQTCHFESTEDTCVYYFPTTLPTLTYNMIDTNSLTAQCWFKADTIGGEHTIFSYTYCDEDPFMGVVHAYSGFKAMMHNDTVIATIGDSSLSYNINDTNWHHIAITRNKHNDSIYLFIDGVRGSGNVTTNFTHLHYAAGIIFGALPGNLITSEYIDKWQGNLTQFRIDTEVIYTFDFDDTLTEKLCTYPSTLCYVPLNSIDNSHMTYLGSSLPLSRAKDTTNTNPCFTEPPTVILSAVTQGVKISPNPANTSVSVKSEELLSDIDIIDLLGSVIIHKNANAKSAVISVEDLPSGLYLVKINRTIIQKLYKY